MHKFIFFLFFICLQLAVFSQDKAELEKRKRQTLQEIELLTNQYNQIKKNKKESIGQLTLIQNKIRLRNQVIENINSQVRLIDGGINTSYREMRRLQKDLDTLKMKYSQNVVYAYKNRSSYDFLNFLFSANSFNDAMRRVAYMRAYRNYRAQQLDAIHQTENLYKNKIVELTNKKKEKSSVLSDQTKEVGELLKDKQEQNAVVTNLKTREKEINKNIAVKRKQAQQLQASIQSIISREIAAAKKEANARAKLERDKAAKEKRDEADRLAKENAKNNTTTVTTTTTPKITAPVKKEEPKKQESYLEYNKEDLALGNNFESNRGRLPFPVDNGYVSIGYGSYTVPGTSIKGSQDFITIASPPGTTVKACFEGEVVSVFDVGGMSAVMIRHGKYFTTYSNLSSTSVNKGQTIKTGQALGRVGTNLDGEGQIDFILARENQLINPSSWLRSR